MSQFYVQAENGLYILNKDKKKRVFNTISEAKGHAISAAKQFSMGMNIVDIENGNHIDSVDLFDILETDANKEWDDEGGA